MEEPRTINITIRLKGSYVKDSKFLYGQKDLSILKNMSYLDALNQKIQWAKSLLYKLQEIDYKQRDFYRINAVANAIKFNEALL